MTAITNLANKSNYSLVKVGDTGIDAFLVRRDLLQTEEVELEPEIAFREKKFLDGTTNIENREKIKHLDFVDVTLKD